jgi:tetratricopeptide (TPR) repeat protein
VLLWAPLPFGAVQGWPLAATHLLVLLGLLAWLLGMLRERHLEWRATALDLPLALLIVLVLGQLALGNGPLARWALAPAGAPDALPSLFLALGTVAPARTARALLLFLTYAGVYVLVVNLIRTRAQLDRLVSTLVGFGGLLGFLALLDYLGREAWLLRWRGPTGGRLSGSFVNPDHFAAWLAMLICLGVGYLLARGPARRRGRSLLEVLRSREGREQAARQYLPFVALLAMTVALVFSLSRGAIASLLVAGLALLLVLHALGRIRWTLMVLGALLVGVLGYGTWIGLEPLLARVRQADYATRVIQGLSTLPMLRAFPILGVGLGAYGDIYPRYQPVALTPGKVSYEYAHDDLLQLAVELGAIGAALAAWMGWRVGRDLLGAHLLGRATCPVGGGEHEGAQRRDPFSVGIAIGALGGVIALLAHSLVDFAARIPANGILAAACLGIATVALHTRFQVTGERLLTQTRVRWLTGRSRLPLSLGGAAIVLALAAVPWIVRPPLVAARLQAAERPGVGRPTALRAIESALALNPRDERTLALRGRLRLDALVEISNSGTTPDGRVLATLEERRQASLDLARAAVRDFETALSAVPSDSRLHDGRARAVWAQALLDPEHARAHLDAARASFSRAIALAPENPFPAWTLAVFAAPLGGAYTEAGLRAARDAIALDPALLGDLVDQFLPLRLTGPQWVAMVPASAVDRADLGAALEERRLLAQAVQAYRSAAELASGSERALVHWALARLELRLGRPREALAAIEVALAQEPDSPELLLVRGGALAALGDAGALSAYRLAALKAEAPARLATQPFGALSPRAQSLVSRLLEAPGDQARYRRALARYLVDRRLWAQALTEWEAVLAAAPRDAEAHFGRGTVLDALGRGNQALEEYRQAVALDGTRSAFRLRLARRLWETEQYYQAMNQWRAVLGQEPGSIEARLGLARAHAKAGDRAAAVQEYRHILQIAPDQPEARHELARLGRGPGS